MNTNGLKPILSYEPSPFIYDLQNNPDLQPFRYFLKNCAQDVENWVYSRGAEGYIQLEVQTLNPQDGSRGFYVYRNMGYSILNMQMIIRPFNSLLQRNDEIRRLYHQDETRPTQLFLAKIFALSQSSISSIVNS